MGLDEGKNKTGKGNDNYQMINSYPLHIEKQLEKVYVNAIKRLSRFVDPKIKKQYKKDIKQFDADNIGGLENEMSEDWVKAVLGSGFTEKEIRKVAILLDRWALAKTNQSIRKISRFTKENARNMIPLEISKDNPIIPDFIDAYTKFNMQLVEDLGHEYIPEISKIAKDAYLNGESTASLSDKMLQYTDGKVNKAKFWAQDQAGDAYTAFTKERQTQAGFTGYIWRSTGDSHVRPIHSLLNQRYFTWAKGAPGLSKPGAKHPGTDYRCRCISEPAFDTTEIVKEDEFITPIGEKQKAVIKPKPKKKPQTKKPEEMAVS